MFLLADTTHRMVIRHDPEIGHLFLPNLRVRLPWEGGGYYVVTNSMGFRSDVEFSPTRSGRPRILFFGDSFTAGDGVENRLRFPEIVGRALSAEVYNYAVTGTGTDQQVLVRERFAAEMPADLVVLCVYVENIDRITVAYRESIDRSTGQRVLVPKPYFTLEDGEPALRNVPVPIRRPRVEEIEEGRFQPGEPAADPLQRFLYKPMRRFRDHPLLAAARGGVKEHLPWVMPAVLRSSGFQPHAAYASAASPGWRLMEAIVRRFITGAAPTPVLIVPIPTYYFYHDGIEPLYQPLFERLDAPARGVHVMDLTTPLYRLPWSEKRRLAFRGDSHFSPFGHERVAEAVIEAIRGRGILPASPPASPALSPPVTGAVHDRARPVYILGISCFYHDAAAALIRDGEIVAAAEEERFSRVKNDRGFPAQAINHCLEEAGIHQGDLAAVVYYDSAPLTLERLLHSIAAAGPGGEDTWARALPAWIRERIHIPRIIRERLSYDGLVLQGSHHRSHAASAFYPSPYDRAAIVTLDGVGEWATGSIGVGVGREVTILKETRFPHSLGLLYSAFTQFTGFKVNAGEYKMMGLAPYGEPRYVERILDELVSLKEDGSVALNMEYFAFLTAPTMTNGRFAALFGGPARRPEARITRREMDIARSIQAVTEEAVLRTARHAHRITGERRLVMAGGVALNCVANGRLCREGPFEDLWIQPAAGDAGGALGAALDAYHTYFERPRPPAPEGRSRQGGSYLGPGYSDAEIKAFVETHGYPHEVLDPGSRAAAVAGLLSSGKVVGHFSGRMEFGPRSLGARAILGDARDRGMQQKLNLKIKYRESFRPFAPSVLADRVGEYFDLDRESPYMLLVAPVKESRRLPFTGGGDDLTAIVRAPRSDVPAVTHVDYSARVQTVDRRDHPAYHDVIAAFAEETGCPVIVNTSFNVRGEPIVCTPEDAYRCFMRTDMDALVLGSYLLRKEAQPPWPEPRGHVEDEGGGEVPEEEAGDGFTAAVRAAFRRDFLPAIRGLPEGSVRVSTARRDLPTTWIDLPASAGARSIFVIPPALDRLPLDPARAAEAITRCWEPGAATEALRPLLAKLLQAGARYPDERPREERVSHTMYVMY